MTNFIFQTEVLQRASAPAGKTRKFGPVRSMSFGNVCKYLYRSKYLFLKSLRHWQDLGYLIIYVTGRPCMQLRKVRQRQINKLLWENCFYHYLLQGCLLALHAQLPRGSGQLCRRILDRPTGPQDRVPEKLTGRSLDRLAIRKTFQV